MTIQLTASRRFLITALAFEGGLGVVALALGFLIGPSPLESLFREPFGFGAWLQSAGVGLLAAVPMLVGLLLLDRFAWGPLRELQALVETHLTPLFAPLSVVHLLVISLAAGIGEELLFRGWLQEGLARWIGPPLGAVVGLLLASLVFGACHWLTTTYAVLAALVGIYLGGLYLVTDDLLVPMVTHAAYDFVALIYLAKWKSTARETPPSDEDQLETIDAHDAATHHEFGQNDAHSDPSDRP
jgi:membrane protease YdiL (CAAX protease family)